jgi:hypothetical protein
MLNIQKYAMKKNNMIFQTIKTEEYGQFKVHYNKGFISI